MVRIVVVDDHELVRRGLRAFLGTEPDLEVVGEARPVEEARALLPHLLPDVVLVDLVLPDGDGVALAAAAAACRPAPRLLALTGFGEEARVRRALEAGFAGYLLKTATAAELAAAVRRVAAGQRVLDPAVAGPLLTGEGVTARERQVLALLAEGKTNGEIAQALGIGEATVKTHVSNLLAKVGVPDRTRLALWARDRGFGGAP
jgi:DNA-binding NarL/FixJ family response regulator